MSDYSFYHLTRQGLEDALPKLLEKAYSGGRRVLVLTGSGARVSAIDSLLWTYRRESFLPHGTHEGGDPALQPILVTDQEVNLNNADFLFVVDGDVNGAFATQFSRCFDLFDGKDDSAVNAARQRWAAAKAAGHNLTYWRQAESGTWEQQTGT